MVQAPAATIVTVLPLVPEVVQISKVWLLNVTGFPDAPPVAFTTKAASPYVFVASEPKLMVWSSLLILKAVDVAVVSAGAGRVDEAVRV